MDIEDLLHLEKELTLLRKGKTVTKGAASEIEDERRTAEILKIRRCLRCNTEFESH